MVGVWYRRMLLSMPCLLLSRIASTAAAALDVGGLEMGVVVGNRLAGLLVELEVVWLLVVVVELEVVAPVDVAPVAPVVVWLEVVVPVVVVA